MKNLFFTITIIFGFNQIKAQNYDFGKISKQELQEKTHPIDSTVDAAILYKKESISFYYVKSEGFVQQREVHERIKIYNKEGFDWATEKVYLYKDSEKIGGIKAATYNLIDGKIVKDKLGKDGTFQENYNEYYKIKTITMPNVKEGSVIEYKYKITSNRISIDDIIFQNNIPINKLEVKVATPEYYIYNKQINLKAEYQPNIQNSSKNNTMPFSYKVDIISVSEENIPALKEEAFAGNISNYRSKMSLELSAILNNNKILEKSFSNSWEEVSKTIYQSSSFGGQLDKSNFYRDDLNVLLKEVTDDFEKVVLIEDFVKSKVKWNGSYGKYAQKGIRNAYKEGEGNVADINLLLVSMLRSQGINANPVLISTRNNGVPVFPTHDGFNYVICLVQNGDKQMLIDVTEKYSSNNILPYRVLNWQGRVVEEDGVSRWISLEPNIKAIESTILNIKMDDDFALTGKVRKNYTSHFAMSYRKKHNVLDIDEQIKSLESNKDGVEINELKYENEEDVTKPVKVTYDFELTDGVDEIGDKLYFNPLLFFATKEVPFKLEKRQYPIDFIIPMHDKYIVNIQLPEGYKVETLPKSEAFTFNDGQSTFKYIIKESGSFLRLTFNFEIVNTIVLPVDYKMFKDFYNKYVEKQSEQIVLTKV